MLSDAYFLLPGLITDTFGRIYLYSPTFVLFRYLFYNPYIILTTIPFTYCLQGTEGDGWEGADADTWLASSCFVPFCLCLAVGRSPD